MQFSLGLRWLPCINSRGFPAFTCSPSCLSSGTARASLGLGGVHDFVELVPPNASPPEAPRVNHRASQGWKRPLTSERLVRLLSLIHISEPTRRTPISYAVFCLKK